MGAPGGLSRVFPVRGSRFWCTEGCLGGEKTGTESRGHTFKMFTQKEIKRNCRVAKREEKVGTRVGHCAYTVRAKSQCKGRCWLSRTEKLFVGQHSVAGNMINCKDGGIGFKLKERPLFS